MARFKEVEKEFIKENYRNMTVDEMAFYLSRTARSIIIYCDRYKLVYRKTTGKNKDVTKHVETLSDATKNANLLNMSYGQYELMKKQLKEV